jgi:hypothetical protein
MSSVPAIWSSIGAATALAMASELAPGKVALMFSTGGMISGNWSMGA